MERERGILAPAIEPRQGLRVLLDARKLWDGGIGVYTENLIAGLAEHAEAELTLIVPPEIARSARFAKMPWSGSVSVIADAAKPYSYDELVQMPRRIPFDRFDLYHVPHYTLPYGIPIPTVITVHDLIHLHHPEKMYYPLVARRLIKSAIRRASRVLTVSQATLTQLDDFFLRKQPIRQKLRLVPNALDPYFLRRCDPAEYLGARFRLHRPFLLSVFSTLKPHKGLKDLLQAFRWVKHSVSGCSPTAKLCADIKLVLVGQGMQVPAEINRLLAEVGTTDETYLFGAVSKEDLVNLYAGAAGLVIPSKAEGFGLPVIEAQAQGTPVVARPVPAICELLTARDVRCADFSVAGLGAGILALVERVARGEVDRGPAHMERFDRREIARAVLQVYREAVGTERCDPLIKGAADARSVGA